MTAYSKLGSLVVGPEIIMSGHPGLVAELYRLPITPGRYHVFDVAATRGASHFVVAEAPVKDDAAKALPGMDVMVMPWGASRVVQAEGMSR